MLRQGNEGLSGWAALCARCRLEWTGKHIPEGLAGFEGQAVAAGSVRRSQPDATGWCINCAGTYRGGSGSFGFVLCEEPSTGFGRHDSSCFGCDDATVSLRGCSGGFDRVIGVT